MEQDETELPPARVMEQDKTELPLARVMEQELSCCSQGYRNALALEKCRMRFSELRQVQPPLTAPSRVRAHAYSIGFGCVHVGVSVYGVEWSFDGYQNPFVEQAMTNDRAFKGVQSSTLEPHHEARTWFHGGPLEILGGASYREWELGETSLTLSQVQQCVEALIRDEYHAGGQSWLTASSQTYWLLGHNCQDFARSLTRRLGDVDDVPAMLLQGKHSMRRTALSGLPIVVPWLGRQLDEATAIHNLCGEPLWLEVLGPTWTDPSAEAQVHHAEPLADGALWEEWCAHRTLRLWTLAAPLAVSGGAVGGGAVALRCVDSIECSGQRVRVIRDAEGALVCRAYSRRRHSATSEEGAEECLALV